MDDKFTQEECLVLINGIKEYELIYNPVHQLYKSKINRDMAWDDICSMVGKSAQLCKKKWRHLRDHYIRGHLKRGNSIENWCYYKPLNFLDVIRVKKAQEKTNGNEEDDDDVFSETEDVQPKRFKTDDSDIYYFDNNTDAGLIPVKVLTEETHVGEVDIEDNFSNDDTEEFMAEIAKRIKRLPASLKDIAKVNILAHITELELQQNGQ